MAHLLPLPFAHCIGIHALLFLLLACMKAAGASTGIMEVDLVFPRNDTYAPTEWFPVVFAIRNSELTQVIEPLISFEIRTRNLTAKYEVVLDKFDNGWQNFSSSDPYFTYDRFDNFNKEGTWMLLWHVRYTSCIEDSDAANGIILNASTYSTDFTIQKGAQEVDLTTPATNKTCDEREGHTMNITKTISAPSGDREMKQGETCAVLSSNTPIPNACRATIDSDAAASISASLDGRCYRPSDCGPQDDKDEKSAAQKLIAGGVFAVSAALAFLLI